MFSLTQGIGGLVGTDEPVSIRLRYKGTGTVTSVTVTTATNIVLITSDGGTDTYAFATYTTIGAVVDAINNDGIFDAMVLDALRADASASAIVDGAVTVSTVEGTSVYDCLVDTSAALHISYRLTANRIPGLSSAPNAKRVHVKFFKYAVNMGTAAADSVRLYEIDGKVETKKRKWLSVDTTATEVFNFSDGPLAVTAKPGNDVLVRVLDAATLADATTNYVWVEGLLEQSGLNQ